MQAVIVEPSDVLDDGQLELDVAEAHAALLARVRQAGTPRGAHDLIIAATARARGRQVVSSDQAGFAGLPEVSIAGGPHKGRRGPR